MPGAHPAGSAAGRAPLAEAGTRSPAPEQLARLTMPPPKRLGSDDDQVVGEQDCATELGHPPRMLTVLICALAITAPLLAAGMNS